VLTVPLRQLYGLLWRFGVIEIVEECPEPRDAISNALPEERNRRRLSA
jgi:hypothetical protein